MTEFCALCGKPVDEVPESDGSDFGDCSIFPGVFCEICPYYRYVNMEGYDA